MEMIKVEQRTKQMIGVGEADMIGTENVRGQIRRVEKARKSKIGLNPNDGVDFLGIAKVLGSKMVEVAKELTKRIGTKHLIT
ncbi:hypothetical protein J1N35_029840 [Gossypium stocksii]|uniref:Uncharacterized protein n=1 Tax=Gossypium stocksii TaxID=47602 RepID=A0A9D3ZTD7_9ROSI|nr:hypothetical protein J1N35_029840 [Gossypium stocksii]